ncbi:MAG: GAF domain-containing protein [Sandaracinaceae bacterium]
MSDDDAEARTRRASDAPVDLTRERESFVRQFLKKGVELTENLLEENKDLHTKLADLAQQNARLRAQIASDDAIRDLIRKIETLERERNELLNRSSALEATQRESETKNTQIEQELHDLANLYVASHHLFSTLSARGVIQRLIELLQQLVGAEICAIYLMEPNRTRAFAIGADGVELGELPTIVVGEGPIGEVMMTGLARIEEDPSGGESLDSPIAVIPLMVRDQAVGAIAIARVFEQKRGWAAVDDELFKLLGSHAATALLAANLYSKTPGALAALEGIEDLLRPSTA